MVEHIDRLTFGPSLNESENPVNNFFFSYCPLSYLLAQRSFSLFRQQEKKERLSITKKRKQKPSQTPKLERFPDSLDLFHLSIWKRTGIRLDGSDFIIET